jgi:hypothetical protein
VLEGDDPEAIQVGTVVEAMGMVVFPFTHPARLEAVGRLFGLDPAPAST